MYLLAYLRQTPGEVSKDGRRHRAPVVVVDLVVFVSQPSGRRLSQLRSLQALTLTTSRLVQLLSC